MGQRVVIGYASSRSEGLMYEALLRSEGVPAFSELGVAFGEFSEASSCGIFAEIELLSAEDLEVIRRVLGNKAAEPALKIIEPKLPTSRPVRAEETTASELDEQEAELNREILRRQGVAVDDSPEVDEPYVSQELTLPPNEEVED